MLKKICVSIVICLNLAVTNLSASNEPENSQETNTSWTKSVSVLAKKVNLFIKQTFEKNNAETLRIKQEIAVRERVLKDMDRDIPGFLEQANNIQPRCSGGSVTVGEFNDPRSKVREEISQLKQQLAALEN